MKHVSVHQGQYGRYGDYFRVYDILTDSTDTKKVLEYCQTVAYKGVYPEKKEYDQKTLSENFSDWGYYFHGYYTLEKTSGGYRYTICEPYAD